MERILENFAKFLQYFKIIVGNFFRWVSNLDVSWRTSNLKITQPDEEDFIGKDLKVVEQHEKFMKSTLKSMGIRDSEDQKEIIERIKILINGKGKGEKMRRMFGTKMIKKKLRRINQI